MLEKIGIWIRDWWLDGNWIKDLYYFTLKACRAIKRFWGYAPIVWADEDWDWVYILRMLKYKIKRTRDNIKENRNHEDCDETVAEMDYILKLIDRVEECDYCKGEFDAHMAKWGERKMIDGPGYCTMAPMSEEQRADFQVLCDKMNAAELADWDELFLVLKRDLKSFWN